jgi:hypothetical protein
LFQSESTTVGWNTGILFNNDSLVINAHQEYPNSAIAIDMNPFYGLVWRDYNYNNVVAHIRSDIGNATQQGAGGALIFNDTGITLNNSSGVGLSISGSGVSITTSDNVNGMVVNQANGLGTAQGNTNEIIRFEAPQLNNGILRLFDYRTAGGAGWDTASRRLQMRIDASDMGFIEFNPPSNATGVSIGSGNVLGSGYIAHFEGGGVVIPGTVTTPTCVVGNAGGPSITSGTGAPLSQSPSGSIYMRTDGAAGSRLYVSAGSGAWNAVAGV